MLNPIVPKAALKDGPEQFRRRPLLVWLTALLTLVLATSGCANTPTVESGAALEPVVVDDSSSAEVNDAAEELASSDSPSSDGVSNESAADRDGTEPVADPGESSESALPEGWDPLGGSGSLDETNGEDDTAATDAEPAPPQTEASIPETLAFSADATSSHSTMLFGFNVQMGMSGDVLEMAGQGAVDGQTVAMQLTFDGLLEAMGESPDRQTARLFASPMTMITTTENVFVKWAPLTDLLEDGKEWISMPPDEDATPVMDATLFDPSTFVDLLHGASDDVRTVGTKEIDGRTVTGYTGTFNLADQLELQGVVDKSSGAAELGDATTTVWISSDDLVRQIESDFVLLGLSYRSSFTFSEYGEPVNIDVPALEDAVPAESVEGL